MIFKIFSQHMLVNIIELNDRMNDEWSFSKYIIDNYSLMSWD